MICPNLSLMTLQAKKLSCWRGHRWVIRHVDLMVQANQVWQLVGDNGVGKSTLLALLAGLLEPQFGTVTWCGETLSPIYHQSMRFLGHQLAIKPKLSIADNCRAFAIAGRRLGLTAIQSACRRAGLNVPLHHLARQLSHGQQKKLALARLLLPPTVSLWLLDEPFAALDRAAVLQWQAVMAEYVQQGGMIVMTSHQAMADFPVSVRRLVLANN